MKVGDDIQIKQGRVCTTFPLSDFNYYMGEERDNTMSEGTIIDAKCFVDNTMHSLLIKNIRTDRVCVVRTYGNEYKGKITNNCF
jgi:hypothetical protein